MESSAIKVAIVGLGKIAQDEHVPALMAHDDFELVAVASPHSRIEGLPWYPDIRTMLQAVPEVSTVSLCTTTQIRYEAARYALEQGRNVLLEKPPGMNVGEVRALVRLARQRGLTLHASWHARHAPAVEPARAWLAQRKIISVKVDWKEDVRVWHPGQTWIWSVGGLGVFDAGINALSILTRIVYGDLVLKEATLFYPENRDMPIAARLLLDETLGAPVRVELDFLHPGPPSWDIEVETDAGVLGLTGGGSVMSIDGRPVATPASKEYPSLYSHFADLVRQRRIDVDLAPLHLVADAFLCGRRAKVEPFFE